MTTNQTTPVTDEELDQMIWKLERDGMTPKQLSLMRELREVRRANGEPVAYMTYKGYLLHAADPKLAEYSEPTPLYTAQPAPVVPGAKDGEGGVCCEVSYADGWNACRAAMLQGGKP